MCQLSRVKTANLTLVTTELNTSLLFYCKLKIYTHTYLKGVSSSSFTIEKKKTFSPESLSKPNPVIHGVVDVINRFMLNHTKVVEQTELKQTVNQHFVGLLTHDMNAYGIHIRSKSAFYKYKKNKKSFFIFFFFFQEIL